MGPLQRTCQAVGGHGLPDGRPENDRRVSESVGDYEDKEETKDPTQAGGQHDGSRRSDIGVCAFFGQVKWCAAKINAALVARADVLKASQRVNDSKKRLQEGKAIGPLGSVDKICPHK
jgi:hypothetical protein